MTTESVMKCTPGPPPSSCLTCRKRKTKCDKARPTCSRCLASGIVCLGYDHIPAVQSPPFYLYNSGRSSAKLPLASPLAGHQGVLSSASSGVSQSINSRDSEDSQIVISGVRETLPALGMSDQSWVGVARGPLSNGYPQAATGGLVQLTLSTQELFDLKFFGLPPKIIPEPALSGETLEFIMSQYGPLLEIGLFKPTQVLLETIRKWITMRICSSNLAHCSMYIGARIFQALANDGKRADLRYLSSCLGRLGKQLYIKSASENTFDGLTDFLSAGLELAFLYFVISNSQAGYTLLKNLVPIFLQVTLSDLNLWSCTGIYLVRALQPPHPSIYRFVLMDALTSLMFGVPPLVEYDISSPQLPAALSGGATFPAAAAEMAPELITMIIRISVWRAKNPGQSAPEDAWRPLEAEAWAYQQSADVPVEAGALQSVARMAIVEGWRHAILIYLYMGMCGVASDDPCVCASRKQIMKLLQVVRGEDWGTMNHFFVPCLMASICTPSEKQRAELSNAFLRVEDTKPWVCKVMEYKPVIDHLWHGAAANGRPIRWEDYVDSRRAMLHID